MATSNYDPTGSYLTIVDNRDSWISTSSLYSVVLALRLATGTNAGTKFRSFADASLWNIHVGHFVRDETLLTVPTHGSLFESVDT